MSISCISHLNIVGPSSDVDRFISLFFNFNHDSQIRSADFEAVLPLNGQNAVDLWGESTECIIYHYDQFTDYCYVAMRSDAPLTTLFNNLGSRYPDLGFIYRCVNGITSSIQTLYAREGALVESSDYPIDIIYLSGNFIRWSVPSQAWFQRQDDNADEESLRIEIEDPDEFVGCITFQMRDDAENPMDDGMTESTINLMDLNNEGDSDFELDLGEINQADEEGVEVVTIERAEEPLPDETLCAVCLTEPTDTPMKTSCGHYYCEQCINQWLARPTSNRKCPICKRTISRL